MTSDLPTVPPTLDPPGHILPNLLRFVEMLRRLGLDVGSGNVLDLVRALDYVKIGRRGEFYQTARSIFVHRKQDIPLFDEAFQVFWRKPATGSTGMDLRSMGEQRRFRKPQVSAGGDNEPDDPLGWEGNPDDDSVQRIDLTRTYSAQEVLRQKDFADFNGREMAEARRMMAALQWDLGRRLTRRMVPGDGGRLDLRRTVRRNLKYGGELLELASKKPKNRPRSLVLICDVSGSMERYTRMFLHFIHTIALGQEHLEAFLFATRLTRITRHLPVPEHRPGDRRGGQGGARLGRRHQDRRGGQDLQLPVAAARPPGSIGGAGHFRRMGQGRPGVAVPGNFPVAA